MAKKAAARKAAAKKPAAKKTAGRIGQQTELSTVQQLVSMLKSNELRELYVQDGEVTIIVRQGAGGVVATEAPTAAPAPAPATVPAAIPAAAAGGEELLEIKSPMVGTFYAAPSPDSDPFVVVGATVNESSAVCIIEAMKVMNEIRADCSGTIREVCVKNAQPVEYGQVLFKVAGQ